MMKVFFYFLIPIYVFIQHPYLQNAYAAEQCESCLYIGILPLEYKGDQEKTALYAQGTQDSLFHALSSIQSLIVANRTDINAILELVELEKQWGLGERTHTEIGQMLSIDYLYRGFMQETEGRLHIFIERVDVATGEVSVTAQVTGPTQNLFKLQEQIVQKILDQLETPMTVQEQVYQHIQTTSLTAYECLVRGLIHSDDNDNDQALIQYSKALKHDPSYARVYYIRGTIYLKSNQYEEAILDFSRALELNAKYASVYVNRGTAYFHLSQYKKAISDFTHAIEHEPRLVFAYGNRGSAYLELKQYEQAIFDLGRAIELNPTLPGYYLSRGLAYVYSEQFENAIVDFSNAIERNPSDSFAYYYRGRAFDCLGQVEKAVEDLSTACQLEHPSACDWLQNNGH